MSKVEHSRIYELMLLCAAELERGCEPLNHAFLVKNEVTIHECQAVADSMAVAIRAFVLTPSDERLALIVRGCIEEPDVREVMAQHVSQRTRIERTTKELAAMNKRLSHRSEHQA